MKVTVYVIVGVDGLVWEAVARNASPEGVRKKAEHAVCSHVYKPLKLDGQIVRVAGSIDVAVEPRRRGPSEAGHNSRSATEHARPAVVTTGKKEFTDFA